MVEKKNPYSPLIVMYSQITGIGYLVVSKVYSIVYGYNI